MARNGNNSRHGPAEELGDFTTTPRVLSVSFLAVGIGIVSAYVAKALLMLIGFSRTSSSISVTSSALVSPVDNRLGVLVILVPVVGAFIVGRFVRTGNSRVQVAFPFGFGRFSKTQQRNQKERVS